MTRNICPGCGERETVYRTWHKEKCANCDWSWKPEEVSEEYPTRRVDAECGEIINPLGDGVSRSCVRQRMCTDGTHCSMGGKGVEKIAPGTWMVVCGIHREQATD